jgi:hypothetical protein
MNSEGLAPGSGGLRAPPTSVCPDTSSYSLPHWLARRRRSASQPPRVVGAYLVVVAVTFVPLLIAAVLGPVPIWNTGGAGPLAFLRDWGLGYALLVSLPSLVVLLVSDEHVLRASLDEVRRDGVIALSETEAASLRTTWRRYFRIWNLVAQLAGIGLGIALGILTLRTYLDPDVASWIAPNHRLQLASFIYLYCIILLYTVIIIYVGRCIVISFFLRGLVAAATPLRILPLHPDKCGGLRPVGRMGLRNQYTLTILGINIVLLLVVWTYLMPGATSLRDVLIPGSVVYLVLGPVIFMAPLLPFRTGMQHAKREWTHDVARVVRVEIDRLRGQLAKNEIDKPDEESIERLRKLGAAIDELPIWPFDPSTLRKFATAYVVPVALPLLGQAALALLKSVGI